MDPNWIPVSAELTSDEPWPDNLITFDDTNGTFIVFSNDWNIAGHYEVNYTTIAQAGVLIG